MEKGQKTKVCSTDKETPPYVSNPDISMLRGLNNILYIDVISKLNIEIDRLSDISWGNRLEPKGFTLNC